MSIQENTVADGDDSSDELNSPTVSRQINDPVSTSIIGLARDSAESQSEQATANVLGSLKVGELLLNRFEIRRRLGRGGFGAVWEAYDRKLGRTVAVKQSRHLQSFRCRSRSR